MMLELRNICKTYLQGKLEVPVLKNISLSVEQGEYLAIMGPSGSGKTTLMNLIGCLDTPTSGEYLLEGEDLSQLSNSKMSEVRLRSIGFVFQSFHLLSRQSAVDNVALPLLYAGVKRKERLDIARQALERVGLGDRLEFKPTQLSGGQCQRVAIARAIVNSPKILLADEPTGALDTKSGEQIMEIFQKLNDEGVTIVMITHEPEIAARAKRILHIRDGQLVDEAGHFMSSEAEPAGNEPEAAAPAEEPSEIRIDDTEAFLDEEISALLDNQEDEEGVSEGETPEEALEEAAKEPAEAEAQPEAEAEEPVEEPAEAEAKAEEPVEEAPAEEVVPEPEEEAAPEEPLPGQFGAALALDVAQTVLEKPAEAPEEEPVSEAAEEPGEDEAQPEVEAEEPAEEAPEEEAVSEPEEEAAPEEPQPGQFGAALALDVAQTVLEKTAEAPEEEPVSEAAEEPAEAAAQPEVEAEEPVEEAPEEEAVSEPEKEETAPEEPQPGQFGAALALDVAQAVLEKTAEAPEEKPVSEAVEAPAEAAAQPEAEAEEPAEEAPAEEVVSEPEEEAAFPLSFQAVEDGPEQIAFDSWDEPAPAEEPAEEEAPREEPAPEQDKDQTVLEDTPAEEPDIEAIPVELPAREPAEEQPAPEEPQPGQFGAALALDLGQAMLKKTEPEPAPAPAEETPSEKPTFVEIPLEEPISFHDGELLTQPATEEIPAPEPAAEEAPAQPAAPKEAELGQFGAALALDVDLADLLRQGEETASPENASAEGGFGEPIRTELNGLGQDTPSVHKEGDQ